jgi:hypothetical protein
MLPPRCARRQRRSQASAFQLFIGAMISQDGAMRENNDSLRRALIRAGPTIR